MRSMRIYAAVGTLTFQLSASIVLGTDSPDPEATLHLVSGHLFTSRELHLSRMAWQDR